MGIRRIDDGRELARGHERRYVAHQCAVGTADDGIDARRFADANFPSLLVAVIVSTVLLVGFTLLAVRRLRRMDVP